MNKWFSNKITTCQHIQRLFQPNGSFKTKDYGVDQAYQLSSICSIAGGDNGGTASSWDAADSMSKIFLTVACCSLPILESLEGSDPEAEVLVELLLSIDFKNFSFESFGADAMTELKTPDSLKPCMMAYWANI